LARLPRLGGTGKTSSITRRNRMSAFWTFIRDDWWIAIPMFAMSLTALTLVIWRLLLNFNARTNMDEFLPLFQQKLEKEGINGALKFCKERPDMIPRKLYAAGLETAPQGLAAMRRAMANVIELEILPDLNILLAPILAIAKIATMVGLFGTVVSMINTFTAMQETGGRDTVQYSGKIGLALFATALGLITAIPLVFAHVLFKDWIAKYEVKMKSAAQKLLLLIQGTKPPSSPSPPKVPPGVAGTDSSLVRR
jgi:biopolymer transport protein ExbB